MIGDGRPLLRVRRVQGAAQLGRKGLRAGEVHVLVLARDVAANREPASEPAVADRARDPHALVETPDVSPQVVLVAVGARAVRALHQLSWKEHRGKIIILSSACVQQKIK